MTSQKTQPVPANRPKPLTNRDLAKWGLAVSLGVLVVSGLTNHEKSRTWHLAAAGAMVGFSAWHYSLYQPSNKKKNNKGRPS